MDARATELHETFVGAFGPYLKAILAERDYPPFPGDMLESAEAWLRTELAALLDAPYAEQRRSPLEIFQEAMTVPTAWLADQGVPAPLRDPVTVAALPGDTYALAPASSAVLGEEAFHAHLGWGAAKAAAVAPLVSRPSMVVVSGNLMDRSRFEEAAGPSGIAVLPWTDKAADYPNAVVAFVDVTHRDADDAIVRFREAGVRVIVFGPHVEEVALERARQLGANEVLARSKLFKSLAAYIPQQT